MAGLYCADKQTFKGQVSKTVIENMTKNVIFVSKYIRKGLHSALKCCIFAFDSRILEIAFRFDLPRGERVFELAQTTFCLGANGFSPLGKFPR